VRTPFSLASHEIARQFFKIGSRRRCVVIKRAAFNAKRRPRLRGSGISLGRHFHRYYFSVSFSRATNKDRAGGGLNYL
jgi:hypothetical protein